MTDYANARRNRIAHKPLTRAQLSKRAAAKRAALRSRAGLSAK